jgi:hypothetical protein
MVLLFMIEKQAGVGIAGTHWFDDAGLRYSN